ncbi:acetyltransferase (GNAT) family protein [Flavobacteriaceae bacterium MAR_2010_72]|nr:acetyltransferase (GNAT) family protein [Flavobacteriaceae bacterium MAR_2010_72]
MIIEVRKAREEEINWINSKYKEINFIESNFENEMIVIAECDNSVCGLGRLIVIDNNNLELGGIYVFNEFRGLNISQEIITFLLEKNTFNQNNIWCLPFSHLKKIYERYGFKAYKQETVTIPMEILAKHQWCEVNYNNDVLLLHKHKNEYDTNIRPKSRIVFKDIGV